jgi:hypothetical protein
MENLLFRRPVTISCRQLERRRHYRRTGVRHRLRRSAVPAPVPLVGIATAAKAANDRAPAVLDNCMNSDGRNVVE